VIVRSILVVALCVALSFPFYGQAPGAPVPPAASAIPPPFTDHYRKSTVSIGRIITSGSTRQFSVVGTGVLVTPDRNHVFLVTAKHVFDEPEQNWHPSKVQVRFSNQEKKSFTEELGIPIDLTDASGGNLWKSLDDGSDIAAIPLTQNFATNLTDAIGYQDFASEEDVYDGATVFLFGYPGDASPLIRTDGLVRAITRSGIIAWTDPNGALDNPLLLDANVLPGNSGGPAFKIPSGVSRGGGLQAGGKVAFLGIVTADLRGYYTVTADGRVVQVRFADLPLPSTAQVQVIGIGGLGRVEPASKVRRLVDQMLAPITGPAAPQAPR
jgi:V8-like Glu-specific endopeptidase